MAGLNYFEISDQDLIKIYRRGDKKAMETLLERYKQLVRMRSRALYLAGGDREDLLQEGMLGLFKAIESFEAGKTSFETYATLCINRQMYTAIAAAQRKKNIPLNGSIPIQELEEHQGEYRLGVVESPETMLIAQENTEQKMEALRQMLSRYETEVLELFLDGNDYQQIAVRLGKSPKSIDNALQRIKTKVQKGEISG